MDIYNEIKEIRKMPHNALRDDRIYHLYQYLAYLSDSEQIDKEKHDVIKAMIGYIPPFTMPLVTDCKDSLYLLTCLYDEVLNNASKYSLVQSSSPKVEIEKYLPYVIEFLKYMGVYEIYDNIKNRDLLTLSSNLKNYSFYGSTYNIGNGNSSIIVKNDNDFRTLITLVHEMGHAYENYLKKDFFVRRNRYFDSECLSTTFEYLFIQFLRNNNLVDENILTISEKNNIIIDLWCIDNAYVYNNYTFENQIRPDNKDIKIPLDEFDELSIIKASNYSLNESTKTCTLKKYRNYYGYGLLFAMVILERFKEDEHETKKFIQSYPKLLYYDIPSTHFGYDLIKLISDNEYVNVTNNHIDKILSKK